MVYEAESRDFRAGEMICFVTVLTPAESGEAPDAQLGRVKVAKLSERHDLLSLVYTGTGGRELTLAFKLDLDLGLKSPDETGGDGVAYDWESGKLEYGGIATDADFAYIERGAEKTKFGLLNATALYDGEKRLFAVPQHSAYDFEKKVWGRASGKWRSWEDEV